MPYKEPKVIVQATETTAPLQATDIDCAAQAADGERNGKARRCLATRKV